MCKKILKYDSDQVPFKDLQNAMNGFEILHSINHSCIFHAIGYIDISEPIETQSNEEDYDELTTIVLIVVEL